MSKCIQSLVHVSWGDSASPIAMPALPPARYLKSAIELWIQLQIPCCTACQGASSEAGVSLILISREDTGMAQGRAGSTFPWLTRRQSLPFILWLRQNPTLWMLRNCYRNSCSGHCERGRARDALSVLSLSHQGCPLWRQSLTVLYSLSHTKHVHDRKVAVCKGLRIN